MPDLKQTIKVDMKGVAKVKANLKELEKRTRKLESAGRASAQTNKKAGASLKSMALAVGGSTVALMALQKVFSSMIKTGKEFEQSMANVKAISGASGAEFKALENNAKKLGATTVHTASAVAGLQTEFAKLGFTAKEITQVTGATLALATATGSDLALSASVAGETLRGFGMDVSETTTVTDVMAKSFSSSALDMQKFSDSMSYVAPISKMAGVSLQGTTAILGQLANAGISGSMAGTSLRKILLEAGKAGSKLATRMGGAITSFEDFQVKMKKLKKDGLDPMVEGTDLVGQRAITAFGILLDGADDVDTLSEALNNAGGSAQEMADIQLDTLEGKTKLLSSAFDGLMITLFEMSESTLKGVTESMTAFIDSIDEEDIKAYQTAVKLLTGGLVLYQGAMLLATIRTHGFSLALTKTGIGAIVVTIGILVAELLKLSNVFKIFESDEEKAIKLAQKHNKELERQAVAIRDIETANAEANIGELIQKETILNDTINNLAQDLMERNLTQKGYNDILTNQVNIYGKDIVATKESAKINKGHIDTTIAQIDAYGLEMLAISNLIERVREKQEAEAKKKTGDNGDNGDDGVTGLVTVDQLKEAQSAIDSFYEEYNEAERERLGTQHEFEQAEVLKHLETLNLSTESRMVTKMKILEFYAKKKKKLDAIEVNNTLSNYSILASAGATFFSQFAGSQKLAGRMKQAQATIDTFATINKIMADPKLIYPSNIIASIEAGARGFANVMAISNQLGEFKTAQIGMDEIVTRPTTVLTGEGGTAERVQVTPLGEDEPTGGGGSPINISFSGNVMSQDFIEDEAIPMIREALRRGEDIGVA